MTDVDKCSKCTDTKNDGLVGCEGPCNKWFHFSCVNFTAAEFSLLSKSKKLFFLCSTCKKKCQIVEVGSIKDRNDHMAAIENSLKSISDHIQMSVQSKLDELLKFKKELTDLVQTEIKDTILSKLETVVTTSSVNTTPPASYSGVVQKQPSFIITPKVKQDATITKDDMIKNINPVSANISLTKVANVRDGGLVIRCENSKDCNKFKQLADAKLTDKYSIKEVPALHPRFKIVGISSKSPDDEFIKCLKIQNKNEFSTSSDLQVISWTPLRKNNKLLQTVIQCDVATYSRVMTQGKLFVGYDYCSIFDAIELRRCYKCCGYHHTAKTWKSPIFVCPLCAQNHQLNDCPKTANE